MTRLVLLACRQAPTHCLVLVRLLCWVWLPVMAAASDISWDQTVEEVAPSGWMLHCAATTNGSVHHDHDLVSLSVEQTAYFHLDHALAGMDGRDEAPLRAECAIAVDSGPALVNAPALLALYWGPGDLLAIGLGDGGGDRASRSWTNRVNLLTVIDGKTTLTPIDTAFYPGASPCHVRLVVTTRMLSAYASADGWNWTRLSGLPRSAGFSGPPAQVILGRGWTADKPKPQLDNALPPLAAVAPVLPGKPPAPPAPPASYHFSELQVTNRGAAVPAALMKDYERKDSREETVDAIIAAGAIKSWQVAGPLEAKEYAVESTTPTSNLPTLAGAPWKTFTPGDSPADRIILLHEVLPGAAENAVRYAVATITVKEARRERFFFDGIKEITVFLNTHQLAFDHHDASALAIDRQSVVGDLQPGENRLVVKLSAGAGGQTFFTLRHDHGDVLYHLALLKRLAIDFPEEGGVGFQTTSDIAADWENLGYQHEAARTLDDVVKSAEASGDQIDHALIERTRLDRELGDEERVNADIEELTKRWAEGTDVVAAQLKAASMWERMGMPAKAAELLAQAAKSAGNDPDREVEIALERLRIHQDTADVAGVSSDLQALTAALPAHDSRRSEFLIQLAIRKQRVGANPSATLREAAVDASPATMRRIGALQALQGDVPGRLATLQQVATLSSAAPNFDCPLLTRAEIQAASKQLPAALADYERAIAVLAHADPTLPALTPTALPALPADPLANARARAITAVLLQDQIGHDLLASLATKPVADLPAEPQIWSVCGPFDNANYQTDGYLAKLGVDPHHVDVTKPVGAIPWKTVGREAWPNGVIDLYGMYHGQNCTALLATDVVSSKEFPTQLSMGADDALTVWVNGDRVYGDTTQRGVSPNSIVVPVTFHQGLNHILVMVEQGGGQWGFQLRIVGGIGGADIPACVRSVLAQTTPRISQVQLLTATIDSLIQSGLYPQAAVLERVMLSCYPDVPDLQFNEAWQFETWARGAGDGNLLMALEPFFEASPLTLDPTRDPPMRDQRWRLSDFEQGWVRYSLAEDILQDVRVSCYATMEQAETLRRLGDLYRTTGFTRLAGLCYTKALGMGVADGGWNGLVAADLQLCRPSKALRVTDTSFELDNQLRTAERANAAGDLVATIGGLQKVIEEHGQQLATRGDGGLQAAGIYVAERLRSLGSAGISAYRGRYEGRAHGELGRALAVTDPLLCAARCEAVAFTYPATLSALTALTHAGDVYLAGGSWALASATFERVLGQSDASSPGYALLAARVAFAAAHAQDAPAFARARAVLATISAPIVVNGQSVDINAWLTAQQALLASPAGSAPATIDISSASTISTFPVLPDDSYDLGRLAWMVPSVLFKPTIAADGVYLTSLSGTRAIDLASGHARWRDYPEFPALRFAQRWPFFLGAPQCQVALTEHLVFARVLRGATCFIEAHDRVDGSLVWSTEGSLLNFSATSSPAAGEDRVVARFVANNSSYVVALGRDDGRVLWQSQISTRRPFIPGTGDGDIGVDGYLAAPTIAGREVLIATDIGAVDCLDLATGCILWSTTYAHGQLDPAAGANATVMLAMRAPPQVLAAGSDIWLTLPRDSMSLVALSRSGSLLWQRPLDAARELSCISADGHTAILGWLSLEAVDTTNGSRRWQWLPPEGAQIIGTPVINGAEVIVPTQLGIARVTFERGETLEYHSWKSLGFDAAQPADLVLTPSGLIGIGNGLLVRFGVPHPAGVATASAGIERGTVLPCAELPAAPIGGPLGISWRVSGDALVSIDVPEGLPAEQCFLHFAHSLGLFDIAKHQVIWRVRLASDVRSVSYTKELVTLVHFCGVTALSRVDGVQRWNTDCSESPLSGVRDNGSQITAVMGEHNFYVIRPWRTYNIEVYDLSDGHHLTGYTPNGLPMAVEEHDGTIFTMVRAAEHLIIDARGYATPTVVTATYDSALVVGDRDQAYGMGLSALMHNRQLAVWFDYGTRKFQPFPLALNNFCLWKEGERWAMLGSDGADHWLNAISDASGKILFQEGSAGGQCWAAHTNHEHLVRCDWDRAGFFGVIGRNLADGKEIWYLKERPAWQVRFHGMSMLDRFAVLFTSEIEGPFSYQLIDTVTGAVAARGPLVGQPGADVIPMATIANQVLYGTSQGLVVLQPTTSAGLTQRSDPSIPAPATLTPYTIEVAPDTMQIDGHVDDWTGIEAIDLHAPADSRSGGGAVTAANDHASLRLCWDGNNLYGVVRVDAPSHRDPPPGGTVVHGDGVLLALDPDADQFRVSAPLIISMTLQDGISNLVINGRPQGSQPDDAHMRAAIDATGITYELALPWSMIRPDPNNRPGGQRSLHVGLLVVARQLADPPRALELGWGLAGGIDRMAWQPCSLLAPNEGVCTGIAFSLFGGHATWGPAGVLRGKAQKEHQWFSDALPTGAAPNCDGGDAWSWITTNPPPGAAKAHDSATIATGEHQHYFTNMSPLGLKPTDTLFVYVYLDPVHPPSEVIVQWTPNGGDWGHRGCWGENRIPWGTWGGRDLYNMGPLPKTGAWVRLEVPVGIIGMR